MKKKLKNPLLVAVISVVFVLFAIITSGYAQNKYSVSGEITYWWKEGQIIAWLLTKEDRNIDKNLVPEARTLKIDLSTQNTQESQKKIVKARTVTFKFVDVPKGTYGILCILDINKNGKLDYPEGFPRGTLPPTEP